MFGCRRCHTRGVGSEVEQELEDRWWLGLRGSVLELVDVQAFTVVLNFEGGSVLTVESAATMRFAATPTGVSGAVIRHADGSVSISGSLMALVGHRVLSSVGLKTGDLRLVFSTGQMFSVPHDANYEAWQLTGPSGRMWVSLPGGGLATFPGRPF